MTASPEVTSTRDLGVTRKIDVAKRVLPLFWIHLSILGYFELGHCPFWTLCHCWLFIFWVMEF